MKMKMNIKMKIAISAVSADTISADELKVK